MVFGISHITFIVKDIERATYFFTNIFEAKEVYSSGEKTFSISKEKFFIVGDLWICIMEGNPLHERTYNHIAFKIKEEDYDAYLIRIKEMRLDIKPERERVEGEGRSIYFYDYDNHLFELHTGTLTERLKKYQSS